MRGAFGLAEAEDRNRTHALCKRRALRATLQSAILPVANAHGVAVRSPPHLPVAVALAMCAAVTLAACATLATAADVIAPNAHLVAENIPPIPAALAAKVAPYTDLKPALA